MKYKDEDLLKIVCKTDNTNSTNRNDDSGRLLFVNGRPTTPPFL